MSQRVGTKRRPVIFSAKAVRGSSPRERYRQPLPAGSNCGPIRKNLPAIVNQILQTMRRNIQGGSIHGSLVASRGLGTLRFQDVVNLVFDGPEFGLGICFSYPANQSI